MNPGKALGVALVALLISACDQLGIETADKVAARVEADGKAVGGACRHAGRALEECYQNNKRASKAAVYAGWRDMDGYMRENNIAEVKPAPEEAIAETKSEHPKPVAGEALKTAEAKTGEKPALESDAPKVGAKSS